MMTVFCLAFVPIIRFALAGNYYCNPLSTIFYFFALYGLNGWILFHESVYIPQTEIPTWEMEGLRWALQFPIVEQRLSWMSRKSPQRNKAYRSLHNVYTAAVFCKELMLTGERSRRLLLFGGLVSFRSFCCTIERLCVTFCLTRRKHVPFFIPSYRSLITLRSEPQ